MRKNQYGPISTVYMMTFEQIKFDMWHNQKFPCGILTEFWKKNLK